MHAIENDLHIPYFVRILIEIFMQCKKKIKELKYVEEKIYVCTYFQGIVNNIGYMLTVCGILLELLQDGNKKDFFVSFLLLSRFHFHSCIVLKIKIYIVLRFAVVYFVLRLLLCNKYLKPFY